MKKILSDLIFMICTAGMILGLIYIMTCLGHNYIVIFNQLGLVGTLLGFGICSVYMGLMLYGFYRLDLKVRRIIKSEK